MEILFSAILLFRNVHEQIIQEKIVYLVNKIAPQGDPKSHNLCYLPQGDPKSHMLSTTKVIQKVIRYLPQR